MKIISIIGSSVFQILSFIFVLAFLLGILNIHFSDKNDYCVMTYMFEYPQFVRISLDENKQYPQYGLYAYSEGRLTEKARKMWFDGVPVLYLPGNAGSYMQARSLASVALRKALSKGYDHHLDFFTINYNEELSGLYGGVLQAETKFAAACISRILSLYKSNKYTKTVPSTVILIGHSMGGVIAKRLLAYPSTINETNIAITLAAPLEAPVINFDMAMNNYYMLMKYEWDLFINNYDEYRDKKLLISFGGGPRDILIPSALTSSNDSYINALTTSIPGVWVSPNHVVIVWCKQIVMAINKYLFAIIDPRTQQVSEDIRVLKARARQYFQANRSMVLSPDIIRSNVSMQADAFWYEDNRRIYQISRPDIDKTTYLMIRLVKYPQNRFVAVEAVNVEDREWVFGCNAQLTYNTHRYCKHAVSLSELSRWTGAANDFGKRKLATINLHSLMEAHPDWSHVLVKVSPTRKPIVLNVDINDYASRQITIDAPSDFSFGKSIIKEETEANTIYYEIIIRDFNKIHQAYLLYVEPTATCKAQQFHVSAEVHVPWAENHEYYHYFTHVKRSPMKLRLYKTNPNVTYDMEPTEHVKVTLLLDPQCTYTISISTSWYHRLAQLVRNYTPVIVPYMSAIVLLAARSTIMSLQHKGKCISIHGALISEGVKPYYALVFSRLGTLVFTSVPFLMPPLVENASWNNIEMQYFVKSLLVLPAYMVALGILNISLIAIVVVMVFSSQILHRALFRLWNLEIRDSLMRRQFVLCRIVFRGGSGLAERVASGVQKVPLVVSACLVCAAPLASGAASLAAGAAFYAFMLSKMYEEYLEDYVYKLMAKVASRLCRMFKARSKPTDESQKLLEITDSNINAIEDKIDDKNKSEIEVVKAEAVKDTKDSETKCEEKKKGKKKGSKDSEELDEDLNNLNFHMMMFLMWMTVTVVNAPALLTWARNFKYSVVLVPDTSYQTGIVMSLCSSCVWQMNGPRRNLRYYEAVSSLLFTMAVFILALGPFSLMFVNYGVTFLFVIITVQQMCDKEDSPVTSEPSEPSETQNVDTNTCDSKEEEKSSEQSTSCDNEQNSESATDAETNDCNVCNENRIYNVFKKLREKFSLNTDI